MTNLFADVFELIGDIFVGLAQNRIKRLASAANRGGVLRSTETSHEHKSHL